MTRQAAFRAGLLDPRQPAPDGLSDGTHGSASKRYDVYRNNVTVSLVEALRTAFPFARKLMGDAGFDRFALGFARAHPPTSPVMMFYGAGFAEYLEALDTDGALKYVPDAARLDLAMRQSYHAADASPLTPDALQHMLPEEMAAAKFPPAPATRVLRSSWPLYDLWRAVFGGDAMPTARCAQDVLITRPEFDPMLHLLPPAGADWLDALAAGAGFDAALSQTLRKHPDFDLAAMLTCALKTAALTRPDLKDPT
ncbi:MAG: DNA-binding domain-containing protein [Pseudomonadota bacterium]